MKNGSAFLFLVWNYYNHEMERKAYERRERGRYFARTRLE